MIFNRHVFNDTLGETVFVVPERYNSLVPKGAGAQGMVW